MGKIDMETVMVCALMAMAAAFGMVVGAAAFMGIDLGTANLAAWMGSGCGLGGILWGILLVYNHDYI